MIILIPPTYESPLCIRKIYNKTRLILIPSFWPEPFGRVAVEGGINGIPCIASDLGGLPEAVGDGGILIPEPGDIKLWLEAIRDLDNHEYYSKLSQSALEKSEKFKFDGVYERLKHIIKKNLDFEL